MTEVTGRADLSPAPRDEFMRGEGFALYTDFNASVLDAVRREHIQRIGDEPFLDTYLARYDQYTVKGIDQGMFGLFAILRKITGATESVLNTDVTSDNLERFGLTPPDLEITGDEDKDIFVNGFSDKAFTWHFSGAIAAASVQHFRKAEEITAEEAANLTPTDWADMIGSAWFSRLMHSLAFTGNGIYLRFGENLEDYGKGKFGHHLAKRVTAARLGTANQPFTVGEQYDPVDGMIYLTTELKPEVRDALRKQMHYNGRRSSTGCPVARRSARLPQGVFETDPHVQALLERGVLAAHPEETDDRVQIHQSETGIDRTLAVIAGQLDRYDEAFGTPVVDVTENISHRPQYQLTHKRLPPTRALKRPSPQLPRLARMYV